MPPAASSQFTRYWTADAISSFGSAVTAVAMPVLVVQNLHATPTEVGVVNAAQFAPYALLGLIAGAYADRLPRRPLLIAASIGRALCLVVIPLLWVTGALQLWMLVVALLAYGACAVFGFAATQSLLPRLVDRDQLVTANSRLDQTDSAAQTTGPALGGVLIGWLGAPIAIVVDAVSYLVEAALVSTVRVDEPPRASVPTRLRAEIAEGVRWTYRHRVLAPVAWSTHVWFLANGATMTVLSLLALRTFGMNAATFGLLLATLGVAGLVGASLAPVAGRRFGSGRVVVAARVAYPVAWLLTLAAPRGLAGEAALFTTLGVLGLAQGLENSNEMAYWQSLTPDELLGRVNGARRSVNRTLGALGALGGGALVAVAGVRPALAAMVAFFALSAVVVSRSPLRSVALAP